MKVRLNWDFRLLSVLLLAGLTRLPWPGLYQFTMDVAAILHFALEVATHVHKGICLVDDCAKVVGPQAQVGWI